MIFIEDKRLLLPIAKTALKADASDSRGLQGSL